jgi:hypothetical protein
LNVENELILLIFLDFHFPEIAPSANADNDRGLPTSPLRDVDHGSPAGACAIRRRS